MPNLLDIIIYLNTSNFDLGYKIDDRYTILITYMKKRALWDLLSFLPNFIDT